LVGLRALRWRARAAAVAKPLERRRLVLLLAPIPLRLITTTPSSVIRWSAREQPPRGFGERAGARGIEAQFTALATCHVLPAAALRADRRELELASGSRPRRHVETCSPCRRQSSPSIRGLDPEHRAVGLVVNT